MGEQGTFFGMCDHRRSAEIRMPSGVHYAKQVCSDCGKFLGWVPKPETIQQRKENEKILTALSKLDHLPVWERRFIHDLVTHKNISPRQQATLFALRDSFLGKGVAHDGFDGEKVSPNRNPSDHV